MANTYTKLPLADGDVLTAQDLNHMQDGIAGAYFKTDKTLTLSGGVLKVNTVDDMDDDTADKTLPITASAVEVTVGNINAILETI